MPMQNFWPNLRALAAFLEGSREQSEETLDHLQASLLDMPEKERRDLRRAIVLLVAQLSRLEMRLTEDDGPSGAML